jgi:hypothetical protein
VSGGEQVGDDFRIEDGLTGGDPGERVDEVADVGDPVLEQVADTARAAGEQLGGVPGLDHVPRVFRTAA